MVPLARHGRIVHRGRALDPGSGRVYSPVAEATRKGRRDPRPGSGVRNDGQHPLREREHPGRTGGRAPRGPPRARRGEPDQGGLRPAGRDGHGGADDRPRRPDADAGPHRRPCARQGDPPRPVRHQRRPAQLHDGKRRRAHEGDAVCGASPPCAMPGERTGGWPMRWKTASSSAPASSSPASPSPRPAGTPTSARGPPASNVITCACQCLHPSSSDESPTASTSADAPPATSFARVRTRSRSWPGAGSRRRPTRSGTPSTRRVRSGPSARRRRRAGPTCSPTPTSRRRSIRAVTNGVRTIEHGNLLDAEAAKAMADHGAYLVPTSVTYRALHEHGR